MTHSIQNHPSVQMLRAATVQSANAQALPSDVPELDAETRSKLLQLQNILRSALRSSASLMESTHQTRGDAGAGAPASKEIAGLNAAIARSSQSQADLARALAYLIPKLMPEGGDDVSTPGFTPPMQNPADLDTSGLIWDSHSDFYAQISALLGVLKTEWLAKYQDAMSTFLDFYKELSNAMEKLKIEGSGDKGDVSYNFGDAKEALLKLLDKYQDIDNALAKFPNEQAAQAFMASLGLPGLRAVPHSDGSYRVMMDVTDVRQIYESMPDGAGTWDSARYNAWVSAKDSNMEQIKHVSKVLGEKLSEMTQKFDNIVKILSSTIDKITEADMSFVHGI